MELPTRPVSQTKVRLTNQSINLRRYRFSLHLIWGYRTCRCWGLKRFCVWVYTWNTYMWVTECGRLGCTGWREGREGGSRLEDGLDPFRERYPFRSGVVVIFLWIFPFFVSFFVSALEFSPSFLFSFSLVLLFPPSLCGGSGGCLFLSWAF